MSLYSVEGLSIGRIVLAGRLAEDVSGRDLGTVQYDTDWGTSEDFGRVAVADNSRVYLEPFIGYQSVDENPFGRREIIAGRKINSSFLRGKLRFVENSNSQGRLIVLGFLMPF